MVHVLGVTCESSWPRSPRERESDTTLGAGLHARQAQSGVTSDAMSGPYGGTAIGAITLEDTTETTRVTQHGSTLSPDPWRASTKPSTSNGSEVQHGPKFALYRMILTLRHSSLDSALRAAHAVPPLVSDSRSRGLLRRLDSHVTPNKHVTVEAVSTF